MKCPCCFAVVGLAALSATLAFAQNPPAGKTPPAKAPSTKTPAATPPAGEMQLPPGMTAEDMQACIEAGTPGEMQAHLTSQVGVWSGPQKMWMSPESPAMESKCTSTITSMFDGRYAKCAVESEIPGMGEFHGEGIYGFDNVSQTFQASWIDSMATGIMNGKGELSSDKKTMTWSYTFTCPITKKPTTMREVQQSTGKDSMTMTMYTIEPKSGKEYKMMEAMLTRQPGTAAASAEGHGAHN